MRQLMHRAGSKLRGKWIMRIDAQLFRENGTWIKPPGAVTVDVVLKGAGAGYIRGDTGTGELTVRTFDADELPGELAVEIGRAGRPGVGAGATGGPGHGIPRGVHFTDGGGGRSTLSYDGPMVASGGPGGSFAFGAGGGGGIDPPRDGLAVIITHLSDS